MLPNCKWNINFSPLAGSESPQPEADTKFQVPKLNLDEMAAEGLPTGIVDDLSKEPERPNEISAPYEAPQFPIELIEDRLKLHRRFSNRFDGVGGSRLGILYIAFREDLIQPGPDTN